MQPKLEPQLQMPQSPSQLLSSIQQPPSPSNQQQQQMPPPSLPPPPSQNNQAPSVDQFRLSSPSPNSGILNPQQPAQPPPAPPQQQNPSFQQQLFQPQSQQPNFYQQQQGPQFGQNGPGPGPIPGPNQQQMQMPLNQINNNFNPHQGPPQQQQPPPNYHQQQMILSQQQPHQQQQAAYTTPRLCAACALPIRDRYLLQCLDRYWHVQCLKCQVCKVTLSDLGEKCFTRDSMIMCRDDYFKMYGSRYTGGKCETCTKSITANEQVMRAFNSVYHVSCFVCQMCQVQLKPGDKFCYSNGRIYCEKDNPALGHMLHQQQQNQPLNGLMPNMNTSPPSTTTSSKRANGSTGNKRAKTSAKATAAAALVLQQQQQQQQHQMMQQQQHHQQMVSQQQMQMQHQQHMSMQQQQQHQQHQQQQMMFQDQDQLQQQLQLGQQIIN